MMEEEERKCKEEKRKVDSSKTILRKEKGLVSSVMIKQMVIHVVLSQKKFQWIPMQKVRSSGSYPDLLEMVTRSGSPSSRDHAGMYAKVGGMSMYAKVRW